jgi:hypothetical protein
LYLGKFALPFCLPVSGELPHVSVIRLVARTFIAASGQTFIPAVRQKFICVSLPARKPVLFIVAASLPTTFIRLVAKTFIRLVAKTFIRLVAKAFILCHNSR